MFKLGRKLVEQRGPMPGDLSRALTEQLFLGAGAPQSRNACLCTWRVSAVLSLFLLTILGLTAHLSGLYSVVHEPTTAETMAARNIMQAVRTRNFAQSPARVWQPLQRMRARQSVQSTASSESSELLKTLAENGDTVGICVSGGLDSKTVALRLKKAGIKVKCFTANLGQPDEEDIEKDVPEKMAPCGVDTVVVDLRKDIAEGAFETIAAQATYDGGYWQSTGVGRYVTVRGLLSSMKKNGVTVLAHGATGRGNDQLRFERYVNVLDPSFKVYAPWRDAALLKEFPGRTQMLAFLQENGIQHQIVSTATKRYSTDSNLLGLSNEAEDLESLETPMTIVNPVMGVWPQDAPEAPEDITLRYEKGRCVAINGKKMAPYEVLTEANKLAGRNGIGISHALENRVLGTKSRGVYEAPGMELLGKGLTYVYQAVLDRRSTALFHELSKHVADQIYDGRYFDPSTRAALTAIWQLADPADGTVKLQLNKGNIWFMSLTDCPKSIYFEEDASMEASSGLNPVSSQGFLEVSSVEAKALAKAGLIDGESVWSKQNKDKPIFR